MSDARLYTLLAIWTVLAIALVTWVYGQARKADRQHEAEETQRAVDDQLWGEMLDAMEADRLRGKPCEDCIPFMLDDDNQPKSANYRKAKELGFVDETPKLAS